MWKRKYIKFLETYWFGIAGLLVGAGLLAGCIVTGVASVKRTTAFEAICLTDHGKLYYTKGRDPVCVRGVKLYGLEALEMEEHDGD